eukprot:359012-Chlamydomonas_euryale.AAC.3
MHRNNHPSHRNNSRCVPRCRGAPHAERQEELQPAVLHTLGLVDGLVQVSRGLPRARRQGGPGSRRCAGTGCHRGGQGKSQGGQSQGGRAGGGGCVVAVKGREPEGQVTATVCCGLGVAQSVEAEGKRGRPSAVDRERRGPWMSVATGAFCGCAVQVT